MTQRLAGAATAVLIVLGAGAASAARMAVAPVPADSPSCAETPMASGPWVRLAAHLPQPVDCAALDAGAAGFSRERIQAGVLDQFPHTALQLNGDLSGLALDPGRVPGRIATCHEVAGPSQPALVTPNQRKPYFVLVCALPLTP